MASQDCYQWIVDLQYRSLDIYIFYEDDDDDGLLEIEREREREADLNLRIVFEDLKC